MSQPTKEAIVIKFDKADETKVTSNPDDLPCFITNIVFARYEASKRKAEKGRPASGHSRPPAPPSKDEQFLGLMRRMSALLEDTRTELDKTNERIDNLAKVLYRFANELVARGLIS